MQVMSCFQATAFRPMRAPIPCPGNVRELELIGLHGPQRSFKMVRCFHPTASAFAASPAMFPTLFAHHLHWPGQVDVLHSLGGRCFVKPVINTCMWRQGPASSGPIVAQSRSISIAAGPLCKVPSEGVAAINSPAAVRLAHESHATPVFL